MNVISLVRTPSDLGARLRELADQADSGEMTGAVVACTSNGGYQFIFGDSPANCVVLSALLGQRAVERMKD